ncbi:precorrin-2 C(20)-methyltransferase [Sebaldella sp. S0638]|uniref:precorrin-2 C(20)-methyltransferase n=1 Tax=Sebaldella sp. S0638 TaxID=2957809 RepID=UPI00209EDA45|nr:precorrin-2 C(20)-methyltransferase [Sebaldella sp. S0638]MCP1225049.1 precorrin-2 C(20)-methyltransferase [Sebaldella sp. S0638]
MKGKFYGVGVGVGDEEELTLKAVRILKSADVLVLPEAKKNEGSTAFEIVKEHIRENTEKLFLEFPMLEDIKEKEKSRKKNADIIKEELENGKNVVFLTIGDPMVFSTYTYILEYLEETDRVETVPGITSFGSMASRLNIPLVIGDEDLKIVSLNKNTDIYKEIENNTNVVFMKLSRNFERLKKALEDTGNIENSILISNCGKENEEIITDVAKAEKIHYFSTLILKKGGLKKWRKFIL